MYMKQLQGDTAKGIAAQISSTEMAYGYVGISTDSKVADEIKRHKDYPDNQFGISGTGGITFNEKNAESLIDVIDTAKAVADVVEEKERSLQAEKGR